MEEDQTEQDNINPLSRTPLVKSFRLLLNSSSDFTARGFGRRVTELGGSFERSHGVRSSRTVHLPNTEKGCALANELLGLFPRSGDGTRFELKFDWQRLPDGLRTATYRTDKFMIKREDAPGAVARSLQAFHVQYQAAWVAYDVQTAKDRKERLEVAPKALRQAILACVKDARAAGLHDDDISEEFIWLLRNWRTTEVA